MDDASALPLIDLPLIRYTRHTYGVECDAWPPRLDEAMRREEVITGWETWCDSTDMRPRRSRP